MDAEPPASPTQGIVEGLAAEAARRFGADRADVLMPVIERTAKELEAIAGFEVPAGTFPAFYTHDAPES